MDIDYLGFIGACHSNTHILVHPEDLPNSARLVLPVCSNYWQNSGRRVHFLSDILLPQASSLQVFKSLPAWIVRPWNQLSSLAALSQHLHWCWYTLIFFFYFGLGCLDCLFGVWIVVWIVSLGVFFVGLFWGRHWLFGLCLFSLTTLYKSNVFAIMKRISEILDAIGAVNVGEHTGQVGRRPLA